METEDAKKKEKGKAALSAAKATPSAKELAEDPALCALGFGAQATPDAAADSELGHEADTGRAHTLDGGNYRKDEIDDLFKEGHVASQKNKGVKKKKKKSSSKDSTEEGGGGKDKKPKKGKKEKSHGLEKVFDAIASTKKKKKSKKRDREAEGDAKSKTKKAKKEKKNFMMS